MTWKEPQPSRQHVRVGAGGKVHDHSSAAGNTSDDKKTEDDLRTLILLLILRNSEISNISITTIIMIMLIILPLLTVPSSPSMIESWISPSTKANRQVTRNPPSLLFLLSQDVPSDTNTS